MVHKQLLWILGYIWLGFGAYWIGSGIIGPGRAYATGGDASGQNARRFRIVALAITFVLLFSVRHSIPMSLLIVLAVLWSALGLYWITPSKSAQSGEFRFYRPLRLVVLAITFALLFWDRTGVGVLGEKFVASSDPVAVVGFVIALCGIVLALWARVHLGKYWSDKVELKVDHQLIRTGPYAHLRHPIYSGVLLGVAGTALLVGEWRGALAFAILLVNYGIKAKREDEMLAGAFADFAEHKKGAGFLLPKFRRQS